jgi:HSP20 family molecular chaperone IbpA
MDPRTMELMEDHVRAIYRALTADHLPELEEDARPPTVSEDDIVSGFAMLAAMANTIPAVRERVPPFSFAPAIDVVSDEREVLVEAAVPGATRADVRVTCSEDLLIISGTRRPWRVTNGSVYVHAEIPCGPFQRVVHLPGPAISEPRVEVENGIIRIRLARSRSPATPQA